MLSHSWFHRLLHNPKARLFLCTKDLSIFLGLDFLVCLPNRGMCPYSLSRPHCPRIKGRPKGCTQTLPACPATRGKMGKLQSTDSQSLCRPHCPSMCPDCIMEFINTWNLWVSHFLEFMLYKYIHIILQSLSHTYTFIPLKQMKKRRMK